MNKYIVISDFYMPDGRKYEIWETVTFVNDSFKNFLLFEKYIRSYDNDERYYTS